MPLGLLPTAAGLTKVEQKVVGLGQDYITFGTWE